MKTDKLKEIDRLLIQEPAKVNFYLFRGKNIEPEYIESIQTNDKKDLDIVLTSLEAIEATKKIIRGEI